MNPSGDECTSDRRPEFHRDPAILHFEVVSTDGGEHSAQYKCENMLKPDASVYCTEKRTNVNVSLRLVDEPFYTITHFVIKAPEFGFTAPVGDGLIFFSYDPLPAEAVSKFNDYDARRYEEFVAAKQAHGEPLNLTDPAAFFSLREGSCLVQKLAVPRFGRYVTIKFLRSRTEEHNIDVQFVGFKGISGPQSFPVGQLA